MYTDLKEKLRKGPCFGPFLKIPRPEVVDVLALAGFDFVIVDMEHAQISEIEARETIKACAAADLAAIVRLPDFTQGVVNRLMEAGAVGVQIPRLRIAAESRHLYSIMHFPPLGTRSVGNANRLAGYGSVPIAKYFDTSNTMALTIGQFETREIEDPCDPMFEGLDVAFIGPMDLSLDFGVPEKFDDPAVVERIRLVERAAARAGTMMGAFVGNAQGARRLVAAGYRFLAVGGDVSMLSSAAKSLMSALNEAREQAAP